MCFVFLNMGKTLACLRTHKESLTEKGVKMDGVKFLQVSTGERGRL